MIAMIGTSDRLCWLAETCKILLLLLDLQPNDSTGWGTCCSDLDSRLRFCISECDSTLFACRSVPRQKGFGDVFATSQSDPLVSEPSERFSATHSAILSLVRMRKLLSTSLCHS